MSGPCTEWVDLADIKTDPRATLANGDPIPDDKLQAGLDVAHSVLYRLTARQFAGVCTDMVRPCARFYRIGGYSGPPSWWNWHRSWGTYTTRNPHRDLGATPLHEITLGAYPLREILEVRIDGAVVPADGYEIHDRRWLVRVPDTATWPTVQNLFGDAMTDDHTFGVWFTWGEVPDRAGLEATKTYSIELAKGFSGDPCRLPERMLTVQMGQGQSFTLLDPMKFITEGKTGLYSVDIWINSVNPDGLRRRSQVYNPDMQRPVRRTQTTPGS